MSADETRARSRCHGTRRALGVHCAAHPQDGGGRYLWDLGALGPRYRASDQVVQRASPWIERLDRFGHVAIGLVYVTAFRRRSDEVRGADGALATLALPPF